jgi:DNA-binding CsgD family transcriptional regulator
VIVLSPTERRVFELFLRGHSLEDVAVTCCISFYTAREHLNAVVRKFGVRSRRDLLWATGPHRTMPRPPPPIGGWRV